MRIPPLLIVLLIAVVPTFAADQPIAAPVATLPAQRSQPTTVLMDGRAIDSASLLSPSTAEGDGFCFKLRTYVMKREGIGDSTRLVKYYDCQKASKYGVKRAEKLIPAKK
jgi:hypothetical protein